MTNPFRRRRFAVGVAAVLWLLSAQPGGAQRAELRPLKGVGELKTWFNANRDHPRVIFLLSPT